MSLKGPRTLWVDGLHGSFYDYFPKECYVDPHGSEDWMRSAREALADIDAGKPICVWATDESDRWLYLVFDQLWEVPYSEEQTFDAYDQDQMTAKRDAFIARWDAGLLDEDEDVHEDPYEDWSSLDLVLRAEALKRKNDVAHTVSRAKASVGASVGASSLGSGAGYERRSIAQDVKMFVWQRDQGKCVYCGDNRDLEFDHIIPVSMGGSNTARNLQLLCEPCNRSKGGNL
jgi:hypothetical protein